MATSITQGGTCNSTPAMLSLFSFVDASLKVPQRQAGQH